MRTVISASRRTDLPRCYPEWLADAIRAGEVDVPLPYGRGSRHVSLRPEDVHTVVLWSKDFGPLLENRGGLRDALSRYEQCYALFTITGLGGTALEPAVPPWQETAGQLGKLADFVGDARRVAVRFDPIVHWMEAGVVRSNLDFAEPIFRAVSECDITRISPRSRRCTARCGGASGPGTIRRARRKWKSVVGYWRWPSDTACR